MELETVRLALTLQAFYGGDTSALDQIEFAYAEPAPIVVVAPAKEPLWPMQADIQYENLTDWARDLARDGSPDVYITIRRFPEYSEIDFREIGSLLETSGFGPQSVAMALCIQSEAQTVGYWLNEYFNGERWNLSLWPLTDSDPECARETADISQARDGLDAAQERMIAYTREVPGIGDWITRVFEPNLSRIRSDGSDGELLTSELEPSERRALLESVYALSYAGVFGGNGTWTDHFPPTHLEDEFYAVLSDWQIAADAAVIAAVNSPGR